MMQAVEDVVPSNPLSSSHLRSPPLDLQPSSKPRRPGHQRNKSSVLRSLITAHRRTDTDSPSLTSSASTPTTATTTATTATTTTNVRSGFVDRAVRGFESQAHLVRRQHQQHEQQQQQQGPAGIMGITSAFTRQPRQHQPPQWPQPEALSELPRIHQDQAPRASSSSPKKTSSSFFPPYHEFDSGVDSTNGGAAKKSPTKSGSGFANMSLRALATSAKGGDANKDSNSRDSPASGKTARAQQRDGGGGGSGGSGSPKKPKKTKSSNNMTGLGFLTRSRSNKNLKSLFLRQDSSKAAADLGGADDGDGENRRPEGRDNKENRTPPPVGSVSSGDSNAVAAAVGSPPPPIYAQFASQQLRQLMDGPLAAPAPSYLADQPAPAKQRPKSFQLYNPLSNSSKADVFTHTNNNGAPPKGGGSKGRRSEDNNDKNHRISKRQTWGRGPPQSSVNNTTNSTNSSSGGSTSFFSSASSATSSVRRPMLAGGGGGVMGSRSTASVAAELLQLVIDPADIEKQFEAMLDRRNIPENQRHKMRSLNDTVKIEFIRQDWSEKQQNQQRQLETELQGQGQGLQQQQQVQVAEMMRRGTNESDGVVSGAGGGGGGDDERDATAGGGGSASKKWKKKKHGRGRSLTIARGRDGDKAPGGGGVGSSVNHSASKSASPTKKLKTGAGTSLGRHFRTKSTESLAGGGGGGLTGILGANKTDRPSSSGSGSGGGGAAAGSGNGGPGGALALLAKIRGHQQNQQQHQPLTPGDFVVYLRAEQRPELVEVGKIHKLRLLLRNETVAWTEDFIRQGGMEEMVALLYRITAIEWREEHEDSLLHENLLCLKALCTTALALQYLHSTHETLFPALLHLIFDPEKKGPSEFTTRSIITSILFTYMERAPSAAERARRAAIVLGFLRDPQPKEEDRPVSFVLDMRRDRPYRVWCREAVGVTKEVFWIFLHNLNVVALPAADKKRRDGQQEIKMTSTSNDKPDRAGQMPVTPCSSRPATATAVQQDAAAGSLFSSSTITLPASHSHSDKDKDKDSDKDSASYMARHFPQERAPVAAAPYVGGVEWDATNYLAGHLDLLNAILACTGPTARERNALRAELRVSGWERCLGASLRMCKEKFYGAVHEGLRTWVAAAYEDGWDVRDVRYGPPPETNNMSRSASPAKKNQKKKPAAAAPAAGAAPADGKGGVDDWAPPRLEMPKLDFMSPPSPGRAGGGGGGFGSGLAGGGELSGGGGLDGGAQSSDSWLS